MKRYFANTLNDSTKLSEGDIKYQLLENIAIIRKNQRLSVEDCDGGLYVGVGGVAYMFWKLSTFPIFEKDKNDFLRNAQKYLTPPLSIADNIKSSGDLPSQCGFLLGNTGIYATAALIAKALGDDKQMQLMINKFNDAAELMIPVNILPFGSDELLVGRAGLLSGILSLRKYLGVETLSEETVNSLCKSIILSGREYSKRYNSPSPLMYSYYKTEYLGAAHGLSGILQMLLSFPSFLEKNPSAEQDVQGSVNYILSLQESNGNFPCATDEVIRKRPESDELVHWCHGGSGVVYLLAKAYMHWKDERYLKACIKCGEVVWQKGLLRKGPGICHGVAGSGYVFLLLYRLTGNESFLRRAHMFANFMQSDEFKTKASTPDNPFSLYEGLAGTACFLGDLLYPDKAHFPFFEVL